MPLRIYSAIVTGNLAYRGPEDVDALDGLDNARKRMEILEPVVKEAYSKIKDHEAKHPPSSTMGVQRIFLAPEYYFSRQRYKDARFFSEPVRGWILTRLKALSRACPDMLIIPGTVLWASQALTRPTFVQEAAEKRGLSKKDAFKEAVLVAELKNKPRMNAMINSLSAGKEDWQYSKSATPAKNLLVPYAIPPSVKGSKPTQAFALNPLRLLGPKPMPINVAFNTAYVLLGSKVLEYHKTGNYQEVKGEVRPLVYFSGGVKGIFTLGGLRYGLEICMDHATGVLADPSNPNRKPVDIHLIVSSFVDFKNSDATVILHSSTQKPGLITYKDGSTHDARTTPVLAQSGVTKADEFKSKESTVTVLNVPNLSSSGTLLEGITLHEPDQWTA